MNGVTFYKTGEVTVQVHFPNGKVSCKYCRLFCRYEEAFRRYSCRLTEEWLPDPFNRLGEECPLTFAKEDDHGPSQPV